MSRRGNVRKPRHEEQQEHQMLTQAIILQGDEHATLRIIIMATNTYDVVPNGWRSHDSSITQKT